MPDQSLSNEPVSGKADQETGNPADTSANTPQAATPESLESNVRRASEGETQQADVTINQDPVIGSGARQASAPADEYDDEDKFGYRDLQHLAKSRDLDASGKRDELVARLREADSADSSQNLGAPTTDGDQSATGDVPRSAVDPNVVENGGIQLTGRGQDHAEILQGLSDERRQQQLSAVASRSERSGE